MLSFAWLEATRCDFTVVQWPCTAIFDQTNSTQSTIYFIVKCRCLFVHYFCEGYFQRVRKKGWGEDVFFL